MDTDTRTLDELVQDTLTGTWPPKLEQDSIITFCYYLQFTDKSLIRDSYNTETREFRMSLILEHVPSGQMRYCLNPYISEYDAFALYWLLALSR